MFGLYQSLINAGSFGLMQPLIMTLSTWIFQKRCTNPSRLSMFFNFSKVFFFSLVFLIHSISPCHSFLQTETRTDFDKFHNPNRRLLGPVPDKTWHASLACTTPGNQSLSLFIIHTSLYPEQPFKSSFVLGVAEVKSLWIKNYLDCTFTPVWAVMSYFWQYHNKLLNSVICHQDSSESGALNAKILSVCH